jgi:MFS family permease
MASPLALTSRGLFALCLASACWAFSFGLAAPLSSLWLKDAGHSDTLIGLNTASYYLGIAVAAHFVPWMMMRWGRGALLLGMMASGVTVAGFPWGGGLAGWFVLRGLNGMAGAVSLIPLETLVNQRSPAQCRARNFAYYALAVALGMAAGNLTGLQLYSRSPYGTFLLGGFLPLVSGVVILNWLPWSPPPAEETQTSARLGFAATYLSFGSAWSQGFIEGSMVALLPVYLLEVGWSEASASWLLSGALLGVIVAQVPVAWLADRLGRTRVLVSCYGLTIVSLIALPSCAGVASLSAGLVFFAASSASFYPLGLSLLGERLPANVLGRANAWYLAINCVGSLLGPAVAGMAMDQIGRPALFTVALVAVTLILAGWVVLRLAARRRNAFPLEGRPGRVRKAA